jgi:seryl-tRNA synthetase
VARAEAAERRGDALREELAATKRAAAAAAKQVASAVADARGGGPNARVEAKEHELKHVEAQVAEAEKRLRSLRRDAEEAAAAPKPVAQKTPKNSADEADPLQTRYASITPRTRSRASLRASHGAARPLSSPAEDTRSPGTELRRRAIAMGMRASPFAPKRKR